jgi:hypothetical protein
MTAHPIGTAAIARTGEVRQCAGWLPHPALRDAVLVHADYLKDLGNRRDLLRDDVLTRSGSAAGSDDALESLAVVSAHGDSAPAPAPHRRRALITLACGPAVSSVVC